MLALRARVGRKKDNEHITGSGVLEKKKSEPGSRLRAVTSLVSSKILAFPCHLNAVKRGGLTHRCLILYLTCIWPSLVRLF